MTHTLVSFLGKARLDARTGYRNARYRFPDGTEHETPFFGLALQQRLRPDRLALFGTAGSMWDVLIEHLATDAEAGADDEARRIDLIDAATHAAVTPDLLARVTPMVERALGLPCDLHLIGYGRDEPDQLDTLQRIAEAVPKGRVSLDLTHGFRHTAALGLLSAVFLERIERLRIDGLYYGALEMSADGITPVIRLDGLLAVQRWIDALDRFDQNGDYAVFAPLLKADGVPADKARSLERAAYYERTMNLDYARTEIHAFLPALDIPLTGASMLFRGALRQRLAWAQEDDLARHQTRLAWFHLHNGEYLRAAIFGYEAVITRECLRQGLSTTDFKNGREPACLALEKALDRGSDEHHAYWMLKNVRNGLAHGNPASIDYYNAIIANPGRLPAELERAMNLLLNARPA